MSQVVKPEVLSNLDPFDYNATAQKALSVLTTYRPADDLVKYGPESWEYVARGNYYEAYLLICGIFMVVIYHIILLMVDCYQIWKNCELVFASWI